MLLVRKVSLSKFGTKRYVLASFISLSFLLFAFALKSYRSAASVQITTHKLDLGLAPASEFGVMRHEVVSSLHIMH